MVLKNNIVKKIGLLLLLTIIVGCNSIFRHNIEEGVNYEEGFDSTTTDKFTLDNNSDLFIRKLYVQENTEVDIKKAATKTKFELTAENYKDKEKDTINALIEIQYLFLNGDQVLYISPIPSEYINDKGRYLLNTEKRIDYPNCYFFNTFYFGKVIGNTTTGSNVVFEFESKKIVQKWNVSIVRDKDNISQSYTVNSIDEYKVIEGREPLFLNTLTLDKAMKNKMTFKNEHRFPKKGTTRSKSYFHFLSFREPQSKNKSKKREAQQWETHDEVIANDSYTEKADEVEDDPNYKEANARRFAGNTLYIFYTDTNKTKVKKLVIQFVKKEPEEIFKSIIFKSDKVEFINGLRPATKKSKETE